MRTSLIVRWAIAVATCSLKIAAGGEETCLSPQDDTVAATPTIGERIRADLVYDGMFCLRSFGRYIAAPLHASADAWAWGIFGSVATGMCFLLDEPLRIQIKPNRSVEFDRCMRLCELYGSTPVVSSVAGGIYFCGLALGRSGLRRSGRSALLSLALASTLSAGIKACTGRSRPLTNRGAWDFAPFSIRSDRHSFPSGHCTAAFALSSALAAHLRNPWAALGLYSLALAVAAQRIYDDRHWLSDTAAGALIGTATGLFIAREAQNRKPEEEKCLIGPRLDLRQQGIIVTLSL